MARAAEGVSPIRLKLISCEILYRELCAVVARSPHQVDLEFVAKGLHDLPSGDMVKRLQDILDRVDETRYDAILLGYALCNNGLVGLRARTKPLIVPRAHDCITLFLGSAARYMEYFNANLGTYFKTTGWIERGETISGELKQASVMRKTGMDQSYEQLVAKYGEDNAKYIWETLGDMGRNYSQITFIEMGLEPDGSFEQRARDDAKARGWKFEKIQGDMGMIHRLVNGPWHDQEFLTVHPGCRIIASFDECILAAEKPSAPARKPKAAKRRA